MSSYQVPPMLERPPEPPVPEEVMQPAEAPVASMGQAQQRLQAQKAKVSTVAREEAGALADNLQRQEGALDAEAAAENDFNKQHVAPIREKQAQLADAQKEAQDGLIAQQLALQGKLDKLDEHANRLAMEPLSDFWSHQSVGVKATALLGQMLGGLTQGLYGGDNQVAKQIDATVQRDMQMQMLQHEHAQQGIQTQRGIYSQMMQLFGDRKAAYHASYLTALEGLNRRLDMNTAKYGDPRVLAANEKAKAALAASAEPHIAALKQWGLSQQAGLEEHAAGLSQSQAAMDNALLLAQAQAGARQDLEAQRQQGKQIGFAEWDGAAKNNKEYNDLNEIYTNSTDFNNKVAQAIQFSQQMNPLDVDQQAVLKGMIRNLFAIMRGPAFASTGANLSKNEEDNIWAQLPGLFAGNVAPGYFEKLLKSTARLQTEKTINFYQRRGLRPKSNNMLFQQYLQLNDSE